MQRALQAEARRSEQNFQRLPALIAAALPVTDVTALQVLPEGGNALSRPRPAAQLAPADRTWLQTLLESAVQQAADKVSTAQVSPAVPAQRGIHPSGVRKAMNPHSILEGHEEPLHAVDLHVVNSESFSASVA